MRLDALGLGNVVEHDVKAIDVAPTLSEATQQYLQLKGMGKAKTFHQAALRNAGTVIEYAEIELLLSIGQQTQDKCVMFSSVKV